MNTKVFSVDNKTQLLHTSDGTFIKFPTLDCYTTNSSTFNVNGQLLAEEFGDYTIEGDAVVWGGHKLADDALSLTITYVGIADHSLLFKWAPKNIADKLGKYHEEFESTFASASTLSMALMAGGIIEGMLVAVSGKTHDKFEDLINDSKDLSENDKLVAHGIREIRNLIHPAKAMPYITREKFLRINVLTEDLIYRYALKNWLSS